MIEQKEKLDVVKLTSPLKWEHKIINGDMYYVQGVLPDGKVLVSKTLTEKEFKTLFSYN